jgi:hypothetical protein
MFLLANESNGDEIFNNFIWYGFGLVVGKNNLFFQSLVVAMAKLRDKVQDISLWLRTLLKVKGLYVVETCRYGPREAGTAQENRTRTRTPNRGALSLHEKQQKKVYAKAYVVSIVICTQDFALFSEPITLGPPRVLEMSQYHSFGWLRLDLSDDPTFFFRYFLLSLSLSLFLSLSVHVSCSAVVCARFSLSQLICLCRYRLQRFVCKLWDCRFALMFTFPLISRDQTQKQSIKGRPVGTVGTCCHPALRVECILVSCLRSDEASRVVLWSVSVVGAKGHIRHCFLSG